MTVSDEDRRELFEGLAAVLDRRRANTLMELLPPVGWSDVARRGDIAELRGEMAELRGEMAELKAELRGQMVELRADVRTLLPKALVANFATMLALAAILIGSGTA